MQILKDTLVKTTVHSTASESTAIITPERFNALRNLILHTRLICDRAAPSADELKALILSWHQALAKIPTEKLLPCLQAYIEKRSNDSGWLSALHVLEGYRMLREQPVPVYRRIEAPFTTPPPEFYEELAKLGFFPREALQNKSDDKKPPAGFIRNYIILNEEHACKTCNRKVNPVVFFKEEHFCLDCAVRMSEIFAVKP